MLKLRPVTFRQACKYIEDNHRHHKPPTGMKFCIGVNDGDDLVGVIVAGRPVSRMLDDGYTLEITRCCTNGTKNAPSMLYGAATRAGFAMGYTRIITYILDTEPGTSLKSTNWSRVGETRGGTWSRDNRPRVDKHPLGGKALWEIRKTNTPIEDRHVVGSGSGDR